MKPFREILEEGMREFFEERKRISQSKQERVVTWEDLQVERRLREICRSAFQMVPETGDKGYK
jgi:hypothetical protein